MEDTYEGEISGITHPQDYSWHWKKLCRVKEFFKLGYESPRTSRCVGNTNYTVNKGYDWQLQAAEIVKWDNLVWA